MAIGRRRRGLAGTAARTAVVVGTANTMNARAADKQAAKQQAAQPVQQPEQPVLAPVAAEPTPQPAAVAPTGLPSDDAIAKIERLAALHESGALSDEEFSALKARALSL